MTSEGNQATLRVGRLRRRLRRVSASSDVHLVPPDLSQELVRVHIILVVVVTGDPRFYDMEVGKVGEPLLRLRDEVGECRFRVFHPHPLPRIPGGDPESDSILANDLGDGFHDLKWEPGTVLARSTVLVGPLVRNILEELVREVSVGEVELDSVESGLVDSLVGGVGVPLDVGFDLFDRHRTRGRVGRGDGDGGRANQFKAGILGLEQLRV